MKTLATIVGIGHVKSAAASLVLAICWLLSLVIVWLLGLTAFQYFAPAMGSLAILTVFALVMATQSASEYPWFAPARDAPGDIPTQFKIGMEL